MSGATPRDYVSTIRDVRTRLGLLERRLPQGLARLFQASSGVSEKWVRLGTINGLNTTAGAHLCFDFVGGSNYGALPRQSGRVLVTQRGTGASGVRGEVFYTHNNSTAANRILFYTRYISDFNFEVWAKLPAFASPLSMVPVGVWRALLMLDSEQTSAPSGLVPMLEPNVDTGWLDLTLAAGFTGSVKARAVGGQVTVQANGSISGTFPRNTSTPVFLTLPAGALRPAWSTWGAAYVSGGGNIAAGTVLVRPDGTCSIIHSLAVDATVIQFTANYPQA